MSKILKSFGLAALLVALLAGTGMADTANVAVTGTVTDLTMTISTDPGNVAFGSLYKGQTITKTDSIGITTNAPYKLALTDDNSKGFKLQGVSGEATAGLELQTALVVTLDPTGTPVVLTNTDKTGDSTGGSPVPFNLKYEQAVHATLDTAGPYTGALTYTLSYNP